jgi:hypothetical protein
MAGSTGGRLRNWLASFICNLVCKINFFDFYGYMKNEDVRMNENYSYIATFVFYVMRCEARRISKKGETRDVSAMRRS